jgi:hypothetical protein
MFASKDGAFPLQGTFLKGRLLGPYSQHFIFFLTYKWAQYAKLLNYTRLDGLGGDKHSSLLDSFLSYEENQVLGIRYFVLRANITLGWNGLPGQIL